MIVLLWVRVCRCVGPHHRGPNVHKVASLPSEKSELRHIGSSPPEKGILVAATSTGSAIGGCAQRNQQRHNRRTTVARAPAALPISGRSLVSSMRPTSLAPV